MEEEYNAVCFKKAHAAIIPGVAAAVEVASTACVVIQKDKDGKFSAAVVLVLAVEHGETLAEAVHKLDARLTKEPLLVFDSGAESGSDK